MAIRILMAACITLLCTVSYANQWHDEADRCWNEAQKFKKEHNYKQTIDYLKRAVAAERKNENPRSEELISQLNELGHVYDILGTYEKSLHYYKLTSKASQKYEKAEQEASALNSIGETYYKLDRYDEAISYYTQSHAISKMKGFKDRMMLALTNMAAAYRVMKDFGKAHECYNMALSAAKETGNAANIAVITSNIGTMYFFKGNIKAALENYSKALSIDRDFKNEDSLSIDMSNMGGVYAAGGKYGEALNYFEKALQIDAKNKNEERTAARLNNIGEIYFRLGYNDRAIENLTRSLEINMKLNNTINAASLQNSLGRVYDSMGRYDEALDHYLKAITLNRNIEIHENIIPRLGDIGMLYETRERYVEAVDYLNKALRREMRGEQRGRIAYNLSNIGRVMIWLKRYEQALDYFRQAMDINRELGDIISTADDLKNSGIVHYYRKEYTAAIDYLRQAIQALDGVKERSSRLFFDVEDDIYRWLIAAYVKIDMPDRAYESNERFCLNKIYSGIADGPRMKKNQISSAEDLKKIIGNNCAAVIFSNIMWDNPFVIVIDAGISSGYELDKAAMVNAVYSARGKEIERFMNQKKGDIIFNISQRSRRDYYYVEFEKIVNYYRSLLAKKYINKDESEIMKYLSKTFYNFLFNKIEKHIMNKAELIIQPDSSLALVPFETFIMTDGRFMAEKYSVRYAYSQSIRGVVSRREYLSGRRSILAMGGITPPTAPSLKKIESARHFEIIREGAEKNISAGKNIREIYGFFGVDDFNSQFSGTAEINDIKSEGYDLEVVSGDRVSEPNIKKMSQGGTLAGYKIIYFGGSGIVIPEVPRLAALIVSSGEKNNNDYDGLLNVKEIAGLNIKADLVHIAGMKINPTGFSRGEGIGDFCGSFIDAGANGVSLSLWPVDDKERSMFMKRVYLQVVKKNIPAGIAFSETKKAFIKGKIDTGDAANNGDYSNPFFWGSFIYYGN
jgi:tetratricopeptide (TPR) repeat protein